MSSLHTNRKCERCGKTIVDPRRKKYCCQACCQKGANVAFHQRAAAAKGRVYVEGGAKRSCNHCGESMQDKGGTHCYRKKCQRVRSLEKSRIERFGENDTRPCEYCENIYRPKTLKTLTCSDSCSDRLDKTKRAAKQGRAYIPSTIGACKGCSGPLVLKMRNGGLPVYCKKCHKLRCKDYYKENKQKFHDDYMKKTASSLMRTCRTEGCKNEFRRRQGKRFCDSCRPKKVKVDE